MSGDNPSFEVHWQDGTVMRGGVLYFENDVFLYDKDYVIFGVNDSLARTKLENGIVQSINDNHTAISSNAFS